MKERIHKLFNEVPAGGLAFVLFMTLLLSMVFLGQVKALSNSDPENHPFSWLIQLIQYRWLP